MTAPAILASRDVYFPIEVASREYSGHLVLGVALALRGFTATLGYKGAVARAMESARHPGVLFYKNDRTSRWSHLIARSVGQDPEGGFTSTDFADFFAGRSGLQMAESADAYFCYGPDDYAFLERALPAANVRMTGSPRVMLWGEAGKQFYADQIAQIREHYGRFVLVASSGARGNQRFLREDREGRLDDERRAILKRDDSVAQEMLRAARHISRTMQRQVIVRPHPAEDLDIWRQALAADTGINVETCFDLAAWIHAADVVIHRSSTAGMESAVAAVPTISYVESQAHLDQDMIAVSTSIPNQVSVSAVGLDALCEEVEAATNSVTEARVNEVTQSILASKFRYPLNDAPRLICDEIEQLGPWTSTYGLNHRRTEDFMVRRRALRRENEAVGVPDRILGPKRRPMTPERVGSDVATALQLLGETRSVHTRFLERDCFTLFCP